MSPESVAAVKLERVELLGSLNGLKQTDWQNACEKLGLWVAPGAGKGSHSAAYKEINCDRSDRTMLVITIQKNLHRVIQKKMLKTLVAYGVESGHYTENDVWSALGFKP